MLNHADSIQYNASRVVASENSSTPKHFGLPKNTKITPRTEPSKHKGDKAQDENSFNHTSAKIQKKKQAMFFFLLPNQHTAYWRNQALSVYPLNYIQPLPLKQAARLEEKSLYAGIFSAYRTSQGLLGSTSDTTAMN